MNKNHLIIALAICLLLSLVVGSIIISAYHDRSLGLASTNSVLRAELTFRTNANGKLITEVQAANMKFQDLQRQLCETDGG